MNDVQLVTKAALYAATAHRRHRRKDIEATPYINHLAEVAYLLAHAGCNSEVIAAGYLHDTIEDVEVTYEMIATAFGVHIADLVLSVTDDGTLPKEVRKRQQVERAGHASQETGAIKLADKISNLRSLTKTPPRGWSEERLMEYVDWSHEVVSQLPSPNPILLEQYHHIRSEFQRP